MSFDIPQNAIDQLNRMRGAGREVTLDTVLSMMSQQEIQEYSDQNRRFDFIVVDVVGGNSEFVPADYRLASIFEGKAYLYRQGLTEDELAAAQFQMVVDQLLNETFEEIETELDEDEPVSFIEKIRQLENNNG